MLFFNNYDIDEERYLNFNELFFPSFFEDDVVLHEQPLFFIRSRRFSRETQPIIKEIKSENEHFIKEKDIKLELYPLFINWKKIEKNNFEENEINYHYNIFKLFGYFGEAIYEILIETNPKDDYYTHEYFLKELYNLYKKANSKEEIEKSIFYNKLMDIYEDVIALSKNKIIIFKEIPVFLIVFKIYQKIFTFLKDNKKIVESLKNQFLILSYMKNEEYQKIFKLYLKKIDFPRNKKEYINEIKKGYKLVV